VTRLQTNKEPKDLRPRAAVMAVVASALFLLLVARLYHLQIVRGDELSQTSRDNYEKEIVEPAARGLILDRRGRIIADNRPSFDIYVTPAFCKHTEDVIDRLSTLLGLTMEEEAHILKDVKASRGLDRFRPYLVKLDVTRDQLEMVEADSVQLEGVDVIPRGHRSYRYGEELAHVVGYMSEVSQTELDESNGKYRRGDFIGRRGVERSMESELRGKDGRLRIAVDAKGRELDQQLADLLIPENERRVPSKPGNNVVLSIDLGLQHIAERALADEGRAGAVVAVDVHTGFVLAMVSEPTFDPNRMTGRISRKDLMEIVDDPLQPLFQRAVQQNYHPGSTFKIVTALAALEKGVVTPDSTTGCNGGYTLGPRRWRCWADKGHGAGINLRRAITQSCDTYFYWLADKIGLDPISSMGERLGFGHATGIELSPEAPGLMPTVEFHDRVDHGYTKGYALNAAIGQGAVNVTPLQLAMAYAALANGGTVYKPHLVRSIQDENGHVVRSIEPEVIHHIDIKPAHLAAIMQGLEGVVNSPGGTAYTKRLSSIVVAGKTGTAQNVVIGEKRLKETDMEWSQRDHAWFASIAPADDPEIAVVVLNEHAGHGGAVAAPVAMAVIQAYFDLKAREANEPLSPQEILDLKPAPQYATELLASREKMERAPHEVSPGPGDPGESNDGPEAPSEEVADPSLLTPPPAPAPATPPKAQAPAEGARPVPE
jgi:penicillin-binding protein 2